MQAQSRRVILTILLLVGLYAVSANESEVFGCNFPRLNWLSPFYYSWSPNSNVHVFIDSRFNPTDRSQLAQGIINWSLWSDADCSGVTFYGFDTMDMSGIGMADLPPDNTVWVISQSTRDGGIADGPQRRSGGFPNERIIAQKIRLNPSASNAPQFAWWAFISAHETGHSFALLEQAGNPLGGARFSDGWSP